MLAQLSSTASRSARHALSQGMRSFAAEAKLNPKETAIVCIEFQVGKTQWPVNVGCASRCWQPATVDRPPGRLQNEFATPKGKLYDAVKDVMARWAIGTVFMGVARVQSHRPELC